MGRTVRLNFPQEGAPDCGCCGDFCCPNKPLTLYATIVVTAGGPCTISPSIEGTSILEVAMNGEFLEYDVWKNCGEPCSPEAPGIPVDQLECYDPGVDPPLMLLTHTSIGVEDPYIEPIESCDPFYIEFGPFYVESDGCTGPENPRITYKIVIVDSP